MTLLRRRILYISFIFIFVLTGGTILFYLQGYRLNTNKWQIERTGAIQADSKPKAAAVSINGQIINDKTPATILSLKPGDYELELSLNGFQPWHKTLKVSPSEVAFTGDVTLWPEPNSGISLQVENLNNSWLSPNGENLLYLTKPNVGSELWLLNLKSGQARLLARHAATDIVSLEWNSSSRDLLTQEKSGNSLIWRTFNLEANSWEEIVPPAGLSLNTVHWGEERNLIYGSTATELYELNLRTQSSKLIWRERLSDFRIHDGLIFGLARNAGEAISLKLLNLSSLKTVPLAENPILSTNVTFLAGNKSWLTLFDADRHALYLLHSPLSDQKPIRLLPDVTTVSWAADDTLVITNNFEIWLYDFNNESPTFIERLSTTLSGAKKYGQEPYILFYSGNEVWVLELDNRDERQRWLVGQFNSNVTGIFLSPDDKTLTVQTADDLYRLDLTAEVNLLAQPTDSPATMIRKYLHLSNTP